MTSLRAWHSTVGTLVGIAFVLMFFTDDWSLSGLALAAGATAFLGGNFFFAFRGRSRQSEKRLWDLSEFKDHQDFSLAAARDLWAEEKSDSGLDLQVKLRGKALALETSKAPLSKTAALAWRVTVDGYRKTRLGAEGDLTPLVDRTELGPFSLQDQDDRARVEPPGILNAGGFREELTTWQGLERFPAVKSMVEEAITLQSLNKEHFPGLRIRETRVEAGEMTIVYGTLSRAPEGFVVRGNDVLDDAGSLLVVADRAHDKLRLRQRRSLVFWLNLLLLVASIPVLLWTLGVDVLAGVNRQGEVRITPGGKNLVVSFQTADAVPDVWTFDADDKRTLVSLTSDDKDWVTRGSATLTLTTFGGQPTDYGPGKARLGWQDGHWLLDPSHPAADQHRAGTLHFRNTTAQSVTLTFPGSSLSEYTWTLKPHEGQDGPHRIVFDDKDWPLPEGGLVVLETGETAVRHMTAGVSPDLKWDAATKTWNLEITKESLTAPLYPLWAVPHPSLHVRGVVLEPRDGQPVTFDLAPETAAARPVRSVLDDEYTLGEEQLLQVRITEQTVLYSGPLTDCPLVKWNKDHWELRL